ncbi:MAG TPA: sulfate reduction electron transfer complex DsrMKJOP subunit DsrM [bacterium]|nr:sulfate reduction electron transfer complex DsrMKJOP subunit DsrM [bacterium]
MDSVAALGAVLLIAALGYLGGDVSGLRVAFGVIVPYAALLVFLAGLIYKVLQWAAAPVPFRIPVTCGQQASLPWIKAAWIENPSTRGGVFARMALEVLLFRSLFRNTRTELYPGPRLVYAWNGALWLAALAFHWSLLVIVVRHLRFALVPVPGFVFGLDRLDGFFQVGMQGLFLTDVLVLLALGYLLARRYWDAQIRYLSLPEDYFALYLLLGIIVSGVLMRYVWRVDVAAVKELAVGLATWAPVVPASVGPLLFVHLTLASALVAYLPFGKLMHLGGAILSPTHNLANTNRAKRHINPWNPPVVVHTYAEWEDEFRDKMRDAGLPLERE